MAREISITMLRGTTSGTFSRVTNVVLFGFVLKLVATGLLVKVSVSSGSTVTVGALSRKRLIAENELNTTKWRFEEAK